MNRRFPISPFDAQRFLPYFGKQTSLLETEWLSGGACNSNYLARLPNDTKIVCRINSRGEPKVEAYVTSLVKDIVPAPEYLWMGDGVSVRAYVEGEPFQPSPSLVREAGRIIGRLSKISFDRAGELSADGRTKPFDGWTSFYDGVTSLIQQCAVREYVEDSLRTELCDLLERTRDIWDGFDRCHNLVHGDFNPNNILVSDDSIVGVLDWEFAHSGCSSMDVGNLMRHLTSDWEHDLASGLQQEGYELPNNWRYQACLIDLTSHLEFLTSQRSPEFKISCVERIKDLVALSL